jgi:hypothetical protein
MCICYNFSTSAYTVLKIAPDKEEESVMIRNHEKWYFVESKLVKMCYLYGGFQCLLHLLYVVLRIFNAFLVFHASVSQLCIPSFLQSSIIFLSDCCFW